MTRLQCVAALAGCIVRLSLFAYNNGVVLPGLEFRGIKKEKAAESHLKLLDGLLNSTLIAYLNGFQDKFGNIGQGAVIFYKAQATKFNRCLPNIEVYNAEAVKAFKAIKLAKECI